MIFVPNEHCIQETQCRLRRACPRLTIDVLDLNAGANFVL